MNQTDNNTDAFFALVRAGLWERDVRLSEFKHIEISEISRLAQEQAVIGLVAAGLEHVEDVKLPQADVLQFVGKTLQLEQRNRAMNGFVANLIDKMRAAGIYAVLVKGQGAAQCYERPLWRSCGDVDLFLSDDYYNRAKELLVPIASEFEKEHDREKHLGMTINGWVVELHGHLYSGLSSRIDSELDRIHHDTFFGGEVRSWNNNGVPVFLLKAENDVFYIFTHILQHFYKEGVGLRQVCDWCRALWSYRNMIDLQLLEARIKRARLMDAWKAFGAYAVYYLGMPIEAMPFYSSDTRWHRKAKRINDFVMRVGNMGHNRDKGNYCKSPYIIRKVFSMLRRLGDLINHAMLLPVDSLRYFPYMCFNGIRSALRGE